MSSLEWLRMADARTRAETSATWIPLRAQHDSADPNAEPRPGYQEEYVSLASVLVPNARVVEVEAEAYDQPDVVPGYTTRGWWEGDRYYPAGSWSDVADVGSHHLVLEQHLEGAEAEWVVHQDLVLALGLRKKGTSWVRPEEDSLEVIRRVDGAGRDRSIEVRLEHLRDYLAFRRAHLLVAYYRERRHFDVAPVEPSWRDVVTEAVDGGRWEGLAYADDLRPMIVKVSRTDGDPSLDVPIEGGPGDDNISIEVAAPRHRTVSPHWWTRGALWRREWVEPGDRSARAGNDPAPVQLDFVTAPDGSTKPYHDTLVWLYFDPAVIGELLARPGVSMRWYTHDTGQIGSASASVHFGVNHLGLVTVLEPDIRRLPMLHQRLWRAHNVTPEGGPGDELFAAQVRAEPAATSAPEAEFISAFAAFRDASSQQLGAPAIPPSEDEAALIASIHRFRARDLPGLFGLCKDMARLIVDGLGQSIPLLRSHSGKSPDEIKDLGSIKLLALVLAPHAADPRALTAPLVGIYELRHQDAHRPSSDWAESLALTGTNVSDDPIQMATSVIESVARSLHEMAVAFVSKAGPS